MITYDLTPIKEGYAATGSYARMVSDLIGQPIVDVGEWQSMVTGNSKAHGTHELEDVTIVFDPIPEDLDCIVPAVDHSWAGKHFLERVSGTPMNPPPSHVNWPYAIRGNHNHLHAMPEPLDPQHLKFDHTYPERFWPKQAAYDELPEHGLPAPRFLRYGIRFPYGDLNDLVDLMVKRPLTRQAYLPVWFPEDTGAVKQQRVPCTLGYHFMVRDNVMSCRYYLRSCDIYRHFSNDVYFAACLLKWVVREVNQRRTELYLSDGVTPLLEYTRDRAVQTGRLVMHIASLHAFHGDKAKIEDRISSL